MKKTLLSVLFSFCVQLLVAQIDTLMVYSQVMGKSIPNLVITPQGYQAEGTKLPVLYLLHGAGGYFSNWMFRVPEIEQYASDYNIIIVCPDGNKTSWYLDSPIDPKSQYETFICEELVRAVDDNYATIANKKGRAITGLSMGGHGAFYLAFRHQELWGAAGSMSGGVDIRPFASSWNIDEILGSYAEHKSNWDENTVMNLTHLLNGDLKLIFDCGSGDFFAEVNQALHEKLVSAEIPHEYSVRPGAHNWDYWSTSIKHHLLFFKHFFEEK